MERDRDRDLETRMGLRVMYDVMIARVMYDVMIARVMYDVMIARDT